MPKTSHGRPIMARRLAAAVLLAAAGAAAPLPASAQQSPAPPPAEQQVPETTQSAPTVRTARLPRTVVAANLAGALVGVTSVEA